MGFFSSIKRAFSNPVKAITSTAKSFTNPKNLINSLTNPVTVASLALGYGLPLTQGFSNTLSFMRGGAQFSTPFNIAAKVADKYSWMGKLTKAVRTISTAKSFMDIGKDQRGGVFFPAPKIGGFMDVASFAARKYGQWKGTQRDEEQIPKQIPPEYEKLGTVGNILYKMWEARKASRDKGSELKPPEPKYVAADPFPKGVPFYSVSPGKEETTLLTMTDRGNPTWQPSLATFARRANITSARDIEKTLRGDEINFSYRKV